MMAEIIIALEKDLSRELSFSAPDRVVITQRTVALNNSMTNGIIYFSGIMIYEEIKFFIALTPFLKNKVWGRNFGIFS